jgi:hypothetical protein
LVLGIYDATGRNGGPGNLLASTSSFTPVKGWNTALVTQAVSLPAATYWLAYLPSSNNLAFVKQSTGPCYYYNYFFGGMPGKFALSGASSTTTEWSFYATLNSAQPTPSATPTATPTPTPTPTPQPTPSPTATPVPTPSPSPTPVPTPSPTPTSTPSPSPTPSPTPVAGTPTLIQHVATGMDCSGVQQFIITLPNPALGGNCLILGLQFSSAGTIFSVVDNAGDSWFAGPSTTVNGQKLASYYASNVSAGAQVVTVTFNGISGVNTAVSTQGVLSEFNNVSGTLDGSSIAASTATGIITTTTPGDLIYHWGVAVSANTPYGGGYNGQSIMAGSGFTLLSADLQVGSCDQYEVQGSAGAVNPSFSPSGSARWGSLAIALKSSASGSAPGNGMRIVHVQHTLVGSLTTTANAAPIALQFPSSGNLLVGLWNGPNAYITGVSDGNGNTWSLPLSALETNQYAAQVIYAANANTGPNLGSIRLTLSGGNVTQQAILVLYDVAGAGSAPFDKATVTNGNQRSRGIFSSSQITPSTSGGIVFCTTPISFGTIQTSNYICDAVVNTQDNDNPGNGGTQNSSLDEDNGYAHVYNTTTSALTFQWGMTSTSPAAGYWGSAAAAFKP